MEKNFVPKESKTIAAIRTSKISEKINKARSGVRVSIAWWTSIAEVAIIASLLTVNLHIVFPFFGTPALQNSFSGPIFPLLTKFIQLFHTPYQYAIQIVNIFFFIIFPVSVYFFVKIITKRKLIGFFTALFVSLPIYPFALSRAESSLLGNDAAHVASIAVFPIALMSLFSFLRKGGMGNLVTTACTSALIALISPFGFMTYLIFAVISSFSEMLLGNGRLKALRLVMVVILSGGLNSFWYNPAFFIWMIIGPLGVDIRNTISHIIPMVFFIVPVLGAFGYLLFDRKPGLQPLFLACFYSLSFFVISMAGGGIFPSHPSRYSNELGFSLALLIGIVINGTIDYFHFADRKIFQKVNRRLLSKAFVIFIILVNVTLIVVKNDNISAGGEDVLGIWDEVDKGNIWKEKERFRGPSSFLGYGLTIATLGCFFVISSKSKSWSGKNNG